MKSNSDAVLKSNRFQVQVSSLASPWWLSDHQDGTTAHAEARGSQEETQRSCRVLLLLSLALLLLSLIVCRSSTLEDPFRLSYMHEYLCNFHRIQSNRVVEINTNGFQIGDKLTRSCLRHFDSTICCSSTIHHFELLTRLIGNTWNIFDQRVEVNWRVKW